MKIKIRDQRFVRFPFELKDEFRKAFPRAKWDADNKEWNVAKNAAARLAQWGRTVEETGVLHALQEKETADLSEREVIELKVRLGNLKKQIWIEEDATERAKFAREQAAALSAKLEALKERMNAARAERVKESEAAAAAMDKVMAALRQVADVDEIERLRAGMQSDWRAVKAVNRDRFSEKQARLREIRNDLEKVNVVSGALNKAISANFNRRDRDLEDLKLELDFAIEN